MARSYRSSDVASAAASRSLACRRHRAGAAGARLVFVLVSLGALQGSSLATRSSVPNGSGGLLWVLPAHSSDQRRKPPLSRSQTECLGSASLEILSFPAPSARQDP